MLTQRALLERLEPRLFLSGTVELTPIPLDSSQSSLLAPSVTVPLRTSINAKLDPTALADRLIGTFRGGGFKRDGFDIKFFDVKLVVTSVSATGFVGSVTTDTTGYNRNGNRREVAGAFTGSIRPKGRFLYVLREPDRRVTIRGKYVPATDRLVGHIRMKVGRAEVRGACELDRAVEALAR